MGLLDTYQEGTDTSLQFMQDRPLEQPKPKPKHSGWTTLPRAVAAGVAEVGANVSDVIGASAQAYADFGLTQNPLQPMTEEQRQARNQAIVDFSPNLRPEQSKPLYEFSDSLRVDPNTATMAESLFFNLGKGLTKAIGGAVVGGPIGGAAVLGVSEGMTQAEELAKQGVDLATRTQVGAVTGAITGASAFIPVAGQTLAQTAGLALVGGPGAYMAQQKITSDILSRANYIDIAQQYDPLDPVGLTVSALVPFGLGLHSMKSVSRATARQNVKPDTSAPDVTEVQPAAQDAQPAPIKTQNFEPQENVDVAMVQNLTIQRDIADFVPSKIQEDISLSANKLSAQESRALKQEATQLEHSIQFEQARYDETFKQLAKDSQATGLSRKQAEASARQILADKATEMQSRFALVTDRLNTHLLAVQADERLNRLNNGTSPFDVYGVGRQPQAIETPVNEFLSAEYNPEQFGISEQITNEVRQGIATSNQAPKSSPLKPADSEPTVVRQTIDRFIADKPDMEVSVREDGTRVKLSDEVQAVRREIENGTDDELGLNDKSLVEAAIQCFLGE